MKTQSEHVADAVRQARLLDYDWDGAGGLPLRSDVADMAIAIFEDSGILEITGLDDDMPFPEVTINGNGTLELAYDYEGKELLLTIQCDGVITYIRMFEDEQTSVEGVVRFSPELPHFNPDDYAEFTELLSWLVWE